MNVLIFGYRGYGRSEGTPSEKGLYLDGEAIARYAFEDLHVMKYIDKNNVFIFGRSLGGAIASHVAVTCNLPFKGIIIENTFSELGKLVDVMFPFLKYIRKYVLKYKFETSKIIGKIKYPVLFCQSQFDELIPKEQMEELFKNCNSAKFKEYYVIKYGNHNEGFNNDKEGYKEALVKFMERCKGNI